MEMGRNTHRSQSHSSHFSQRSTICPPGPFVKTSAPHSPTEKWEFLPLTELTTAAAGADACRQKAISVIPDVPPRPYPQTPPPPSAPDRPTPDRPVTQPDPPRPGPYVTVLPALLLLVVPPAAPRHRQHIARVPRHEAAVRRVRAHRHRERGVAGGSRCRCGDERRVRRGVRRGGRAGPGGPAHKGPGGLQQRNGCSVPRMSVLSRQSVPWVVTTPRLSVTQGGGGGWQSGILCLNPPPNRIRNFFLRKEMKFRKRRDVWQDVVEERGGKWEENGMEMGRNTHRSQSHSSHFPGGRRSAPRVPL